jgi:hypothetical protein
MATSYDLNAIADALRDRFQGLATDTYGGVARTLSTYSEPPDNVSTPALAIELDEVTYDVTMGRGADVLRFLAYLVVDASDSPEGQRLVRRILSSGGLAHSLKDKLEEDVTLGGLVSYAHMAGTRTIGTITYNSVDYQGATLEIQVVTEP